MVSEGEEADFKAVAEALGLDVKAVQALGAKAMPDPGSDMDGAKKELEDLFNLM